MQFYFIAFTTPSCMYRIRAIQEWLRVSGFRFGGGDHDIRWLYYYV